MILLTILLGMFTSQGGRSMEVTANIEITDIPDDLSVFEKAGFSKYINN